MEGKIWRNFDLLLLLAAFLLVSYGLAMVYSSSISTTASDTPFFDRAITRQALYALGGIVLMLIVVNLDYRLFGNIAPFLYFIIVLLLGLVLVVGQSIYGARRWVDLVLFPMQPSEIAKLIIILVLSKYLSDRREEMKGLRVPLVSLLMVAVPVALIYLQPNLSTALIFAVLWLGMAIMAGVRWLHLAALITGGAVTIPLVYLFLLPSYVRERVASYLNPTSDPFGAGYNVLQAEISVGSGGLLGKGFAQGTQSQLHFLRVQNTDFIFSVLGEELGFVGALLLFCLFALLLFRGVRIATRTQDTFGRLIATGIVIMILFQVFINVAVNIRLLPVTGIPLPFISYGGSSLITLMIALGILESIAIRRREVKH